ncbi:FKBP-type peptidyl-prolyl cis-trans isomerase [Echinicola vietnamensis]|uniref:Peptidyl-prolyl cis-trans isomerase n=1 Tax=Echinicola vietnamensis (strain DSM 17526 / LMG 23754 / KMM 6221) TaxID=926556 RepID=L0FU22_ECHVK|nr:FKBP-type peptidyl-prolyl cis-trans isomerase [Echinicola vietnamensis]AGA77404.1 FKBP-type peptidyl-prolyl cis-trans isomerase [Echinicola vietnamensis DSM 17526]
MNAEKNKVISVAYELHVDDGENGKEFKEKVSKEQPFAFLFGAGNTLPSLEEAISGKQVGDTFDVFIDYENAYGDYDESKVAIVPKSNFKEDGKKNKDLLKVGKVIPMQDDQGNHLRGEITKVDYKGVHMDFNSPLAGYDLHFKGEIVAIRDADPEEIEHGHVHGPGGHHH